MKWMEKFCRMIEALLEDDEEPVLTEEEKQQQRIRKACMLGASGRVTFETKEEQEEEEDEAREDEAKEN
jgi:hypothetical protein